MPGENAECTCLALRNLFEWLGGVPERIVFDNAAGVGHKGYGEREPRLTHLFQAFQAHYGFDCSFCNPYSGHEKGAVESKVGMVRRKLFVPRPSVWSLENLTPGRRDWCLEPRTRRTLTPGVARKRFGGRGAGHRKPHYRGPGERAELMGTLEVEVLDSSRTGDPSSGVRWPGPTRTASVWR